MKVRDCIYGISVSMVGLTLLLWGSGCATPERATQAELNTMHAEPKLKAGFTIDVVITIGGTKEIEELGKRVTANGKVALPLLGEVTAVPLTLKELKESLKKSYSEYFVAPNVSVSFSKNIGDDGISPWGAVTVMGRVVKPGKVNIPPTRDLTVSRAIQRAGGFSTSANQSSIKITRRLKEGQTETIKVNLKSLGEGKLDEDILLYPGDVVFVPERIL